MEWNVHSFDIAEPLSAYHFTTFLARLATHSTKLESLYADVQRRTNVGETNMAWAKKDQLGLQL